jgi:hypothetical protein
VANLAAIGAFTAAAVGVVNVGLQAFFAGRASTEQWRREQLLPVIQEFLDAVSQVDIWLTIAGLQRAFGGIPTDLHQVDRFLSLVEETITRLEIFLPTELADKAREIGTEARATAQEVRTGDKALANEMRQPTPMPPEQKRRLPILRQDFIAVIRNEMGMESSWARQRRLSHRRFWLQRRSPPG